MRATPCTGQPEPQSKSGMHRAAASFEKARRSKIRRENRSLEPTPQPSTIIVETAENRSLQVPEEPRYTVSPSTRPATIHPIPPFTTRNHPSRNTSYFRQCAPCVPPARTEVLGPWRSSCWYRSGPFNCTNKYVSNKKQKRSTYPPTNFANSLGNLECAPNILEHGSLTHNPIFVSTNRYGSFRYAVQFGLCNSKAIFDLCCEDSALNHSAC